MARDQFLLPPNQIYMCGHSLGPMPKLAKHAVEQALNAWSLDAVQSWNVHDWMDLPRQIAAKIAPLLGASEADVVINDSTSVNLFKVLMSALKIKNKRSIILTTDDNFPADLYIAQGIKAFDPRVLIKVVKPETLLDHMDEHVAVLMLTHVNYRDASVYDMAKITAYAHQQGILTAWDLSHSVGAIPLALNACGVDFAVGCTYKYLNGGPGSPAFLYVNQRHQARLLCPIYGWMGHDRPFEFEALYQAKGSAQYGGGTPGVLGLHALKGALDVLDGVDQTALHEQSLVHSERLITALELLNFEVMTPKTSARGGHVAFMHPEGYALSRALIAHGVTVDYREPGLIRLCVNPLYLSSLDMSTCIATLRQVADTQPHHASKYQQKLRVT
jgi:kynureninase